MTDWIAHHPAKPCPCINIHSSLHLERKLFLLVSGDHYPLQTVMPPSIGKVAPVTQAASSEARYRTIFATSSGDPGRRIAYCARMGWSMSGLVIRGAAMGVSIRPGFTTLQRIPSFAYSTASPRVKASSAPLDAV